MAFSRTSTSTSAGDIYALIRDRRDITRAEIRELTGLSRTAVTARLATLAARDLLIEREQAPSTGGRPATYLTFNADAGVVLSAAIGRSRTRLAVCNLAGDILASTDIDQSPGLGPDDLMPDIVKRLDALLDDSGRRDDRIYGVGVNLPGTVDQQRGCSLDSPIMTGWDGVPLPPYFAELTDAPVILDNDANVIASVERRGDRAAFDDLLVSRRRPAWGRDHRRRLTHRGAVQAAGEFGHNKTPAAQGVPCRCGDTGCLEAIAGGWAWSARCRTRAARRSSARHRGIRQTGRCRRAPHDPGQRQARRRGTGCGSQPAQSRRSGGRRGYGGSLRCVRRGLRETLYGNATALATRACRSCHAPTATAPASSAAPLWRSTTY